MILSWWRNLTQRYRAPAKRARALRWRTSLSARLLVEPLEDRWLPAAPTSLISFPLDGAFYNASSWDQGGGTPVGDIQGTASATDATVTLVEVSIQQDNTGDFWDGSTFVTSGTELFLTATGTDTWSLDFASSNFPAEGSYTVHSQATDDSNEVETTGAFATFTYDTTAPVISLDTPANGSSATDRMPTFSGTAGTDAGDSDTVTVNVYSGIDTNGTLTLSLDAMRDPDTGAFSVDAIANLLEGTYTAQAMQTDAGGNIGFSATTTFKIDLTAPTVTVAQADGQADPTNSSPILFTALFSEPVSGFDENGVLIGGTANPTTAVVTESGPMDGTTYTIAVSGMTNDGTVTASIMAGAALDTANNSSEASTSTDNTVTYDTTAPVVSLDTPADGSSTNDQMPTFSGTAGIDDGDSDTVTVNIYSGTDTNGTLVQSLDAMRDPGTGAYSVDATANLLQGMYTAQAMQTDAAGNTGFSNTTTFTVIDITPPTVTVDQADGQADPTNSSPILFTALFSEPVTGFDENGVLIGGTANPTTAVVTESGPMDGTTYTIAVSGMTNDGTVTASILAGAALDTANNPSEASTSTDNTVTYDTTAPVVSLDTPADGSSTNDQTPTFSGTAGIDAGDSDTVTVNIYSGTDTNGTLVQSLDAMRDPISGAYSVDATANLLQGMYTAQAMQTDTAGNTGFSNTTTFTVIDITPPTVTVDQADGQADPTNSSPILFTALFSEPVSGFDENGVLIGGTANPTTAVVTESGPMDGTTYTITVSGMTNDGTVTVSIMAGAALDTANNPSEASTSTDNTVTYDATAPVVSLDTPVDGSSTNDQMPTFSGTAGIDDGDSDTVTVNIYSGIDTTGTLVLSLDALRDPGTGTYSVDATSSLPEGTYTAQAMQTDAAGNIGFSDTTTFTIDVTVPMVTLEQAADQTDPTNGSPILFTAVFSEPVTGFDENGVLIGGTANPLIATVTESGPMDGTTYTIAVSGMLNDGTVTVSIVAGAGQDAAGNLSLASTSVDNIVTYDATAPAAPSAPVLASSSDTGIPGDNTTSVTTPVLTGTADSGTTVILFDGSTILGFATTNSSGNWTFTSPSLSLGAHTITAQSLDAAGNTSATSASLSLTIIASESLNQRVIIRLYQELLGRTVDANGLAFWTSLLDQGASADQVMLGIVNSTESHIRMVNDLYRQFLGRDADALGLTLGVAFLDLGGSLNTLRVVLLSSDEYFARVGGTLPGFLEALYRDILGRGSDPISLAQITAFASSGVSRATLAQLFVNLPEGDVQWLQGLYQRFLHREIDPSGQIAFASFLQQTARDDLVIAALLGSAEYASLG
jgi:Bacterial Ig-like domain/Domain of unknown function (DUF4214)